MCRGIPLKVSVANQTVDFSQDSVTLSIDMVEKDGTRNSICGSPLELLKKDMDLGSVVSLAKKTNTTFIITLKNQDKIMQENRIELSKDGYKRFDQDHGTKARTTPEPRMYAWLDVKVVEHQGKLSITSQSGPNYKQAHKDAALNRLFTETLSAVLNVLGCNPSRETLTVKEEDRVSPVSILDL